MRESFEEPIFLNTDLEKEFRRNGYIIRSVLSEREIHELKSRSSQLLPETSTNFFATAFITETNYRKQVFDQISKFVEPAIQKLLPKYRCCQANYVVKHPGTANSAVPVHQDHTFVNPDVHTAIHVWTPLVDVNDLNGCLKVMPGSHSFFNHICAIGGNPNPFADCADLIQSQFMRALKIRAGEAVIYDGRLLHASEPNMSQELRVATACVMLPQGVKPRIHQWHRDAPDKLTRIEISDQVFQNFDTKIGIAQPYVDGVEELEPLLYKTALLRREKLLSHMEKNFSETSSSHIA